MALEDALQYLERRGHVIVQEDFYRANTSSDSSFNPTFQQRFRSGELPVILLPYRSDGTLHWLTPLEDLDIFYFLPIFFDGLKEVQQPFDRIANIGLHEMLTQVGTDGRDVPLENIMNPLCCGLSSKNCRVVIKSLIALQHLYEVATLSLHPYYPRFLPILLESKEKLDDEIEKGRTPNCDLKRKQEIKRILNQTICILNQKPER